MGEWSSSIPDYILYKIANEKTVDQPTIVFVGTYMHARIGRIARWVKRSSDYDVHLVCGKTGFLNKLSNNTFDETQLFRNSWHLKRLLKKYDSSNVIVHCFGPPHLAAYEVMQTEMLSKKVFDYQDLMITNFGFEAPFPYMKKELEKEEFILNKAQLIVNHSLELQVAKKNYASIPGKKLYFPNYADNDFFIDRSLNERNEIHIVYAGSVYSKFRNSDYFGGSQLHWLIHKLNNQGIHFHIYPAPTNVGANLVDYEEMNNQLQYFHLHAPLKQDELSKALSKYDFGVLPFFDRLTKVYPQKRRYSTTLKLLNYAEAGIPVIMSEDLVFQHHLGNKVGVAIKTTWEEFDQLKSKIEGLDLAEIRARIQQNRAQYSIEENIHRLLTAYQDL
ncbi:MAG: hypothetical protein CMO34_04970 [Verrucomicrobia bacterium]|nr:hypothetical protein [Verrucomicrobiota bacterium]